MSLIEERKESSEARRNKPAVDVNTISDRHTLPVVVVVKTDGRTQLQEGQEETNSQ